MAETIPYLMGPFDPSAEETITDIDSISTEIEFSNENDFFHHQVQTARQHYPMAVMDLTNMESGVHTPVLKENDTVDMLENSGGDWSIEDGASEFTGYSTSSTLVMKRQEGTEWTSPPAKKKTHRRSHYTFVGN
jgi:hypothetical protein